jgi:thioredoxin 1
MNIEDIDGEGVSALFQPSAKTPGGQWTLLDFWAPWCAPCRTLHQSLTHLAKGLNEELRLARVDIDAVGGIADQFGIRSIPTLILVRDGVEIARHHGVLAARALNDWLQSQGLTLPEMSSPPEPLSGEPVEIDARTLGAFYGDEALKRFLLERTLRMAEANQIHEDRFPHFTRTGGTARATIGPALAGGELPDLFVRVTALPLGISGLLHLCGPTTPAAVEALVGSIQPGADLRGVPLRFMLEWLSDDYAAWPAILDDDEADALRRDWLNLASQPQSPNLLTQEWAALKSRAAATDNLPVARSIGRSFAKLLIRNMPLEPDSRDFCRSLIVPGIYLQFLEGFRLHKMSTAEINWESEHIRWLEDLQARENLSNEECLRRRREEHGELDARMERLHKEGWQLRSSIKARHSNMLQTLFSKAPQLSPSHA